MSASEITERTSILDKYENKNKVSYITARVTKKKSGTVIVRFQVLTAAGMMFRIVFWDVLPCKIIVDRRFRGAYCLHHQG
jgi:hypothetical protein